MTLPNSVVICCRYCGIQLSKEIVQLMDLSLLREADGVDYVPLSYFFVGDGKLFTGTAGKIFINIGDSLNLNNHFDRSRLNGCCGMDGCDGMNKLCKNGHEVATEKSDCWMPHAMLFDPQQIDLKYAANFIGKQE
jgi:hypothetical protein